MESFPAEVHGLRVWSFGRPSLVNNAQAAAAAAFFASTTANLRERGPNAA